MRLCFGLLCDRTAAVWMRGKAWCIPCSIKRFGFTTSAPDVAEAAAPTAAPDREAGFTRAPHVSGPAPGPTSLEDFRWILENDGWRETEWELLAGSGWLVPDTERFLKAHLNEGIEP